MSVQAADNRSAMRRRTPRISWGRPSSDAGGCAPFVRPPTIKRSRSACSTRPAGPVPCTAAKSIPSDEARARTAGAAVGRASETPAVGASVAVSAWWVSASSSPASFEPPSGAGAWPSVSMSTNSLPTARTSPGPPCNAVTTPVTGHATSTVALSVSTSARTESGVTASPTATNHSTISASATPSPTSGNFIWNVVMPTSPRASPGRPGRGPGSTPIRARGGTACPSHTPA